MKKKEKNVYFYLTLVFASAVLCLFSTWKSNRLSAMLMMDNVEAIASGDRFNHDYQICYPTASSSSVFDEYKCDWRTDLHDSSETRAHAWLGLVIWSITHSRPKDGTYQCPYDKIPCNTLGDYGFCWKNY